MVGHTKGPWAIGTNARGDEICTIHGVTRQPTSDGLGQGWVYIHYQRTVDYRWHWADEAEKMANAHLITAAPELFGACEEALTLFDGVTALDDHGSNKLGQVENLMRTAIAKAKGESA